MRAGVGARGAGWALLICQLRSNKIPHGADGNSTGERNARLCHLINAVSEFPFPPIEKNKKGIRP